MARVGRLGPVEDRAVPPPGGGDLDGARCAEETILRSLWPARLPRRTLDLGCGSGRLLSSVLARSEEVVALDLSWEALRGARRAIPSDGPAYCRADAVRLPFKDGAFSCVLLVRVMHRLSRPDRALAEVRRVLEPDGILLVSYAPRPSVKTIEYDVAGHLRRPASRPALSLLRGDCVRLPPSAGGGHSATRRATEVLLAATGFELEECVGTGFYDLSLARHLPARVWPPLARVWGRGPGAPTYFGRYRRASPETAAAGSTGGSVSSGSSR